MKSKIISITLVQFIGIHSGLGQTTLEVDFSKLLDYDIILILGDNGSGKSTFASVAHPLVGTTDSRTKFIRKGQEGIKIIRYLRDDGCEFECKIVYSPTKTGHSAKAYMTKIDNGIETDLNGNGNIGSYEEALFTELGVSKAILKLSSQNDTMLGLVDMTSTNRKLHMSEFLPDDIYSSRYAIVDKSFKETKTRLNIVVDNIGKLSDTDTIEATLKVLTDKINTMVDKRDKCIAKIKEYETRIDILQNNTDLEKLYKKTSKYIIELSSGLESIKDKIRRISTDVNVDEHDTTISKLNKLKDTTITQINQSDKLISVLSNNIERLRQRRNDIMEDLTCKESILQDITSDSSLSDLKSIHKKYTKRYNELDEMVSKLDTNLTKDDLFVGYDIVRNVSNCISNINDCDSDIIKSALANHSNNTINNELTELYAKREKAESISTEISSKITALSSNAYLKDILDKRPKDCSIDDCPFIDNARKWTSIEKDLESYQNLVEKSSSTIASMYNRIEKCERILSSIASIKQLLSYVKMNLPIINKLPYSSRYSTPEALITCISKRDPLTKCDDFDEFIEILECKDEYNELKYIKIPSVENQIMVMETQGKIIDNARQEVKKLKEEDSIIDDQLKINKTDYDAINESMKLKTDLMVSLDKLYDTRIKHDKQYDDLLEFKETLNELEEKLNSLKSYQEKLKDKKLKLIEVDRELQPLSKRRELFKMEQFKLADYLKELSSLQDDMYKIEIIRDSLSTKKGIPVQVMAMYMDEIRVKANSLLSMSFNGSLYLELFIIDEDEFTIPFRKTGDIGEDISHASSAERAIMSLCLTFATMDEIVSEYGVMILDEVDRSFNATNKCTFVSILVNHMKSSGINQSLLVTHSHEYYTDYNVGMILFPGHGIEKYNKESMIKVY